jgi:capsular polysaccharide transport system ATP-binding protein
MGGIDGKHTANENARFIARLYDLDPDYVEAFCRYVCLLDEYFDMPVATYSSGMKARLAFSLLLALDFDVYLIDEGMPASTDVAFNRRAGAILKERLENATVVVVSHSPTILEKFCNTAAVLRDGRLIMFDTLEEARALYEYDAEGAQL